MMPRIVRNIQSSPTLEITMLWNDRQHSERTSGILKNIKLFCLCTLWHPLYGGGTCVWCVSKLTKLLIYRCCSLLLLTNGLHRFLKMDYPNPWGLQWRQAEFQPVICHCMFWMVYFLIFVKNYISDDDDVWNYNDVGELSNETDHDSRSICYWYLDTSDDKSYSMKQEEEQRTVLSMKYSIVPFTRWLSYFPNTYNISIHKMHIWSLNLDLKWGSQLCRTFTENAVLSGPSRSGL